MSQIKYFGLTKQASKDRDALIRILNAVKKDHSGVVCDLKAFSESGQFDQLAMFLVPQYMTELFDYDSVNDAVTVFQQNNSQFKINSLNDLFARLLSKEDLQLVKVVIPDNDAETTIQPEYVPRQEPFNTLSVINNKDGSITYEGNAQWLFKSTEDAFSDSDLTTNITLLPVPKSEHDIVIDAFKAAHESNKMPPVGMRIYHYVISNEDSWNAARQFTALFDSVFPKFRKNVANSVWTEILQSFISLYRNTVLKLSSSARPLLYATGVDDIVDSMMAIADDNNVVEEWRYDKFNRVSARKLVAKINQYGDVNNTATVSQIPVSENATLDDDHQLTVVRIPVAQMSQAGIKYESEHHEIDPDEFVGHYEFDGAVSQKLVFDDDGNPMHPVDDSKN